MNTKVSAKICMFRLNELGDCFLITFTAGKSSSRLLIDCGSFRNSKASIQRIEQIVGELGRQLDKKPLDVVVGTHQHNDHLSGFVHCEKPFEKLKVQEVWLSWLDDPTDRKAREIGKAHHNLRLQLATVRDILQPMVKGKTKTRPTAARAFEVLDDMLGFDGAATEGPPDVPARGVKILKSIGQKKSEPEYLRPGRTLQMPGLPSGTVRVHVLGPPRVEGVERKNDPLYRIDPKKGESYDPSLAAATLHASKFLDAVQRTKGVSAFSEEDYPFNQRYKRTAKSSPNLRTMSRQYAGRTEAWRKIDDDWLQQGGALALYLNNFTNNSSLVLAIELVESGKVLLFAADAQTGNWDSWKDVKWENTDVKTDDLLKRTVFYKVGHHASHNATLPEVFEKMNSPDLVALIPVHKKDPNITKLNGWRMPARNLFNRLKEKTSHRVLQMDNKNPPDCDPAKSPAKESWKKVGITPTITDNTIEIEIDG